MSVQLEQIKQKPKASCAVSWILVVILIASGIGYFTYSQMSYSDGFRSGQLVKISRRGVLFKTYEGSLNLSPNGLMTNWDFSAKNDQVAKKLEESEGKLVRLHYRQRYRVFFWQGDTEYIVDAVEVVQ
ncbi:MAG: 6-phosphogluconate dehydrogenase [Lewinellaceae bacterium]|nr:6-phosphogluconate dehydrogenase [Lewinellaceae bacterium]